VHKVFNVQHYTNELQQLCPSVTLVSYVQTA